MIEEDDGVDVNKEMKRRMTQLMDVDHVYNPSVAKAAAAKGSSSFKRVELPGMNEIEGTEEAFNLEPLQMHKKSEQFSFGKIDQKKGQSQVIEEDHQ